MQNEQFLRYYKQEIAFLLEQGKNFANTHPQIAESLGIHHDAYADPHLSKLIESFAFLSGAVNKKIDDNFNKIIYQLLNLLFPQFLHPTPPFSIMQFTSNKMGPLNKTLIPKKSQLYHKASDIFVETCVDLELTDTKVKAAEFDLGSNYNLAAKSVLKLQLSKTNKGSLKLFFDLDYENSMLLFRLLFDHECQIFLDNNDKPEPTKITLNLPHTAPLQTLYELTSYSNTSFDLIHQFVVFYKHFMFIELNNLPQLENCTLLLTLLDAANPKHLKINQNNVIPNCVPVMNLFDHATTPFKREYAKLEYILQPQNPNWQVHSINGATGFSEQKRQYSSFIENDKASDHWIMTALDEHTFISFTNQHTEQIDETITVNAKHTNKNIGIIQSKTEFLMKKPVSGLKSCNLYRFTQSNSGIPANLYLQLIKLFHTHTLNILMKNNYLPNLLGLFDHLNQKHIGMEEYVLRLNINNTAKHKRMQNILCSIPCVKIDIHINPNLEHQAFMFAFILGKTFQRLESVNTQVEFNIKLG